ncbi:MAG: NADH-quinone oxidoreductase subunit H [Patescibacteria group bacterium]
MTLLFACINTIVIVAIAPLTIGIIRKGKAYLQNRRGASIFLPYLQIASLMRKEMTITEHSSWVFRSVPFVVLASALFITIAIPAVVIGVMPSALTNIFVVVGALAFGAVFLVMGGMDTASTFGNMGSSREMTLSALVEPVIVITLSTLALLAGSWGVDGILTNAVLNPWADGGAFALTLCALLLITLLENARYPVDNPATHLELTMVHEAMILEYSGPYLALLEYAAAIKLTVMAVFVANLALPYGLVVAPVSLVGILVGISLFCGKVGLAALVIALVETLVVKMRFYRMQEYVLLSLAFALAGLSVALLT